MESGWTQPGQTEILDLAVILFVDDTDLPHLRTATIPSLHDFLQEVQGSTTFWARLLQATGGDLKGPKCFYYLMVWNFH